MDRSNKVGANVMVAIVSGNGLGVQNTSGWVLGSRGQLGQSALGRAGDNVYVNAANGNLVVQNTDEILVGLGPDNIIARTYNSQGLLNDDNGDNWRASVSRKVTGLTGTVNSASPVVSTITLIDWDGSQNVYSYDSTRGLYVFEEGAGAHDTLAFTAATATTAGYWTWTDGDSRIHDTFESHLDGGRVKESMDLDGNALTFAYNDGVGENKLIKSVTTEDGGVTSFVYLTGTNKLAKITTSYTNAVTDLVETITRVSYAYNTAGRLSAVTVDLSPEDNSTSDGNIYTTNYGYDSSGRVNQITQTDGSKLVIAYDTSGKVTQLTQTVVAGTTPVTRVTGIEYVTATTTKITDPSGQATTLTYDGQKRLIQIDMPVATSAASPQQVKFEYDTDGNVITVNGGPNNVATYEYEAAYGGSNGNWTIQRDSAGNTVRRTYGSNNQLLTETLYTTPDPAPDEAGVGQPAGPLTTRYAYDSQNHLVYVVSAEGRVTQYLYTTGLQTGVIEYTADEYDVSALGTTTTIAASTLTTWVGGLDDKSTRQYSATAYDLRGNVTSIIDYGTALSDGSTTPTDRTRVYYTYDQAGRMLSQRVDTSTASETFIYDGLGRLIASTDYAGVQATVQFYDALTKTVVTLGNVLTKTSVYNKSGELISYMEAPTGDVTASSSYRYDAVGRLRISTDATGVSTHYLYDFAGRKVAEITADGALREYVYDANDNLVETIRYATGLTSAQMATLVDTNGNPAVVDLATLRPASVTGDRYEWRIYDNAQRLIEVIDAQGYATIYVYDGASRLLSTARYANNIANATVTTFKTTPPTTKQTPGLSAANDRVERNFYDADGLLVGSLDGEGYLTQIVRDGAGRKIRTVGYATLTLAGNRASGSFTTLLADVTATANAKDIETRFVYDGRGFLRAVIDGEGNLTRYNYSPLGYLTQEISGQQLTASQIQTFEALPRTIANLPAAAAGLQLDTTSWTRNNYGQTLTEVRTLTSGSETVTYTYDSLRRLVKTATTGTNVDSRTQNQRYDAMGRLIWTLSGEGSVALAATGADIDTVYDDYGTYFGYDDAGRLLSKTTPNGDGTGRLRTLYYYDEAGNLSHTVNALGEVVEYRYDVFGQRTDTIVHANRLATGGAAWTALKGGRVSQDSNFTSLFTPIPDAANDSQTHIDYNLNGMVSQSFDALGYVGNYKTTYTYNAFRQVTSATAPIASNGVAVQTTNAYDRRGFLLSSTRDSVTGGLQLATSYLYDAFGRAVETTDSMGRVRKNAYDRAGQVISATDALNQTTTYAYDGRGNVVTLTDRNNATTSFAYTAHGRQVTMTTAEGLIVTTKYSAYGDVLTITDGGSRTQTWTYNKDGELKTYNDGAGTEARAYDMAGRLMEVTDARLFKTTYAYDAANRVVTRTVDPITATNTSGLNLVTSYQYDAKGQQFKITDPSLVVTQITFDKNGQKTQVAVDPTGLNLRTAYGYDRAGRMVSVSRGSGTGLVTTTQYTYDKADRLIKTQVNPSGLNLTTEYAYDANGNMVAKKDAAGAVSRYVYDAENRLIHSVDGAGGVLTNTYDAEGRVTSTRGFTNTISTATLNAWAALGWSASVTTADVTGNITAVDAKDHLTSFVYDRDGRLRFSVDAAGRPTEYVYDGSGNVLRKIEYAGKVTTTGSYSLAYVQSEITAKSLANLAANQITRAAYDGANRQVYSIDAEGRVTLYGRDSAGNVINQRQYAVLYTATDNPSAAALGTWAATNASASNDRITRFRYDNSGRLAYEVDALGYVTEYEYDGAELSAKIRYATAYSVVDSTTTAQLTTSIGALPTTAAVTGYTYDAAGRLIEVTDPETFKTRMVLDVLGQATQITRAFGTGDASTTQRVYDAAGRVTSETKAYAVSGVAMTTAYTYDGMGRALTSTIGGAVTTNSYDGAGRLTSEDQASLTSKGYAYDGVGQLVAITDAMSTTVTRTYNALGNLISETTPLVGGASPQSATVNYSYDVFGNRIQVSDPRTNSGLFYYNKLNRLVLQIDPEGFATATTYTMGGEVASVTQFATKITGATTAAQPTPATSSDDATTTFARDKLDRLTGITDAEYFTESYTLDSFGNRKTVTNKLGGITTNTYDKRGLLTQESKAITWKNAEGADGSTTIINKYRYDGRGNLTSTLEGLDAASSADTAALRTTTYTYNKADLLVAKSGDLVTVTNQATFATTANVTPTETYKYDSRGNLIEMDDASGAPTFFYYDLANRRTTQVNALGAMKAWTYDANGNVLSERTYGSAVTLPTTAGGTPPTPVNATSYREVTYGYDLNNRLTTTTVAGLRTGAYSGSTYSSSVGPVTTTRVYDKAGNVIQETDGAGNSTYTFYDKRGMVTGRVDAEKYATFYTLNYQGNVSKEERFATALGSVTPGTLPAKPAASAGNDRITDFTYDSNGRRLTETRTGVVAWMVDSFGALAVASTNALIQYSYNALGEVTQKIEANLDTTDYSYDNFGRQTIEKDATFTDFNGNSVRRLTENSYDRINNLTQTRLTKYGVGATIPVSYSSADHVTSYSYDKGGRLSRIIDAEGFQRDYGYDITGRVVQEKYTRLKSDLTTSLTEANTWQYDALGRVTQQAKASLGTGWTFGDKTQTQYNVYGDVSARGLNGMTQETFTYDAGGRLTKSNAGDGTVRFYYYDGAGRMSLTVGSSGRDNSAETTDSMVTLLTNSGATAIGGTNVSGVTLTFTTYDKRGLAKSTAEPFRLKSIGGTPVTITHSRTYNAFGEVASETNGNTQTTTFAYNTMGRLIQKTSPLVSYTGEDGVAHNNADATPGTADDKVNPVEKYYYDLSGRLVGTQDAEAVAAATSTDPTFHANTRILLAGTGHGDDEALATDEFHNDGGHSTIAYDVFGNARTLTNELSKAETRVYDKMDRLVTLNRRGGLLTETYVYDGLGQRIKHSNNFLTTTSEKIDYDLEGRVSTMVDFGGAITSYGYTWGSTIATGGLGTFGGWTKATSNTATGKTSTDVTDYFGHAVSHVDNGGHVYAYNYDLAGRLATETMKTSAGASTFATSTTYTWLNTGLMGSSKLTLTPGAASQQERLTTYTYNAEGSQLTQGYSITDFTWNSTAYVQTGQTVYQVATVTYDALERMTSYTDTGGTAGGKTVTVNYEYDRNGNVRRTAAEYFGQSATTSTTVDHYYLYDSMNRFTLVKGTLAGGVITRGTGGTAITWDQAGQRHTALDDVSRWVQIGWEIYNSDSVPVYGWRTVKELETYSYTDEGYLSNVGIATGSYNWQTDTSPTPTGTGVNRVTYNRDAMGRLTSYYEYDTNGTSLVYSRTSMTYDTKSQLLSETTRQRQVVSNQSKYDSTYGSTQYVQSGIVNTYGAGGLVSQTSYNDVTDSAGGNGQALDDTSVSNSYVWWDGARQSSVSTSASGQTNTSTYAYDAGGDLSKVTVVEGGVTRYVNYGVDAEGRILRRYDTDAAGTIKTYSYEYFYYFDGVRVGDNFWEGFEGSNYAQIINNRHVSHYDGYGVDFDQAFDPINGNEATTASRYTVQAGDTLASIAYAVWGDESLWYVLADANGMTSSSELAAGMTLTIPGKIENVHNTATTFRPYDPNKSLGKVDPKIPLPKPPKGHSCGIGQILVAIIAIAVVAIVAPHAIVAVANFMGATTATGAAITVATISQAPLAASMIGGAIAGAAGSIVSQGVGMAIGIQDKFSWKGVAMAALGGAVGGGIRAQFGSPTTFAGGAVQGAAGNAITQGIGVATGLQDRFDWTSVAVAGIAGGIGAKVGGFLDAKYNHPASFSPQGVFNSAVTGMAAGMAGAAAHSLIDGSDFGDNIVAILPDIIAQTVGNAIGGAINNAVEDARVRRQAAGALVDTALSIDPTLANTAEGRASLAQLGQDARHDIAELQRLQGVDKGAAAEVYDRLFGRLGALPLSDAGRAVLNDAFHNVLGQAAPGDVRNVVSADSDLGSNDPSLVSGKTVTATKYGSVAGPLDRLGDQAGQLLNYTDGQVAAFMDRNPSVRVAAQVVGVGLMVVGGVEGLAAGLVFDKAKDSIKGAITETYQSAQFPDGVSSSIASGQTWLASMAIGGGGLLKLGMTGRLGGTESAIPTIGGRAPINSKYAGQIHPSGVSFTEQGFPNFKPYAQAEVEIPNLTGRYQIDERLANQAMAYPSTPKGYVWHHVEDGATMQLIPESVHKAVRHTGGAAVIRNGGFD